LNVSDEEEEEESSLLGKS